MKFWLDSAPTQAKQCNRLTHGPVSERGRPFRFRLSLVGASLGTGKAVSVLTRLSRNRNGRVFEPWFLLICKGMSLY